jgi:hypothetical protein
LVAVFRPGIFGKKIKLSPAGIAEAEERLLPPGKGFAAKGAAPGKEEFPNRGEKRFDFHTLYRAQAWVALACV